MTGRGQDAAGFTVLDVAPPRVAGDEVAISGERFSVDGTPGQAVTLAGNGVQVVSWTTGEVRIRVPRTAGAGGPGEKALVVRTPWGESVGMPFQMVERPTVTDLVPDPAPPDLLRLLFLEFATAFGNDWFSIPVDGVPLGSLTRLSSLVVRDTFGRETEVGPFAGEAWRVFHLSGEDTDGALLLPPVVVGASEAPPLEEVVLLRDEMANMGWAVERTVAGATGRPLRRQENQGETQARGVSGLSYRLMTGVPEFWIPLVPRELQGSPRLARVAMRRMAPDGQPEEIPPRGRILGGNELLIHDEEVPRDGANVTRAWQLARDPSGQTHLWIGRSKGPGRGEGSSGLAFDVLEEG